MNKATSTTGASEKAAAIMTKRLCAERRTSNSNQLEIIQLENGKFDISNDDTSTKPNKKPHRLTQVKIHQDKKLKCIKQYLDALPTDILREHARSTALETLSAAII
eukprot:5604063-Ditylum_brightwellii.AAC.1